MRIIRQIHDNQFLRHNAVFFAGSIGVGALNYLYYPVLGRLLSPASFGEVQTLVSIFLQLNIFLTVLSLVVVNIVTNTGSDKKRNELIIEFERLALVVSFGALVASLLLQGRLQSFLQFESAWPFSILALAMLVSVPFVLRGAVLRGKQRFGLMSAGNVIAAGAKIVFSSLLVVAGLGTIGAIGGIVLAQAAACLFVAFWALRLGFKGETGERKVRLPNIRLLRPELRYGAFVLLGSLAITLQYSLDIVIIKHYFDAHVAGLYAGVASVARVVFFITASVPQVLISSVRMRPDAAKQNKTLLLRSAILLAAMGLPALLLLVLMPGLIMRLLMGDAYQAMSHLLPRLSTAIFIVSVLNLLSAYYLALRRYGIAIVSSIGVGLTYLLIFWHHGSPDAVVTSLLQGSIAMLCLSAAWIASSKLKEGSLWRARDSYR
ncbi:MAG TPA: oligosaccharide flippase family protein [Candidatus Saccharimonadales bacterium]|nr:oligosaccharide flippase family protein [Candidatus Saccharimonadales bacterium]